MFDFTPLQNIALFVIFILVFIFYARRFWFWFWKSGKLMTQFDAIIQPTETTNETVKEMNAKLDEMQQSLEQIKKGG